MLSVSAAVAPLSPVPVGVCSSVVLDWAPEWGTLRKGCFCLESLVDLDWSSVDDD
jgi:hypothetical protein